MRRQRLHWLLTFTYPDRNADMDQQDFTERLAEEGYAEIVSVSREAGGALDVHTHPFEAKALIVAGEIFIRCVGEPEQRYGVGEIFHLPAGAPHAERYGAEGVTYLVGRK